MAISDYTTSAAANTAVGGVSVAEGWSPAAVNNAIRALMADIATMYDDITGGTGDFDGTIAAGAIGTLSGTALSAITLDSLGNVEETGKSEGSVITYASGSAVWKVAYNIGTTAEWRDNTSNRLLTTDQVWSAGAEVSLSDSTTVSVDMDTFVHGAFTIAGNRTLGNPTNAKPGQTGRIRIIQDGTGSRTLAYGSNWAFVGGTAPTLSTTANAVDYLYYDVVSASVVLGRLLQDIS